jgi:hypothetical protein
MVDEALYRKIRESDNMQKVTVSKNERKYHVWQCVKRRDYARPHGKPVSDACGLWQVKSSKYAKPSRKIQANCIGFGCDRRPRLNPDDLKIYTFDDLETALQFADDMNRGDA